MTKDVERWRKGTPMETAGTVPDTTAGTVTGATPGAADGAADERTPRPRVHGWEVERALGQGGSSTVWLVTGAHGERAALKVPDRRPDLPTAAVQEEMDAVAQLRHEHVVRPLGVVETDAGPGLLSEYHAGGSLGALVRAAGPLPLARVVTVLVPIAQALEALHAAGVVHGDVSPGNILFTVQGRPALGDLGCARVLGGTGRRCGTPGFAAPELADGEVDGGLDPAADLYSLAAVGWYALTGRAPSRTTARAPLPMILPEVPGDVVRLLEAGLDDDPAKRPDAAHFAVACYRWAAPEPLDLFAAASPEVARELPTRHRAAVETGRPWTRWRGRWDRRRTGARRARSTRPRGPGRWHRRRWWIGGGAAMLVAALLWGGVVLGGSPAPDAEPDTGSRPSSSSRPVGTPDSVGTPDPVGTPDSVGTPGPTRGTPPDTETDLDSEVRSAVEALGPARARALTTLAEGDLAAYSVPDSPAHASDVALMEQLSEQGLRFRDLDLRTRVDGEVTRHGPDRATVVVDLRIGPYRTVTTGGEVVESTDGSTRERLTARLQRSDHGWRVQQIGP